MKKFIFLLSILLLFLIPTLAFADDLSKDNEMREFYENEMNNRDYLVVKARVLNIEYDDTAEKRDVPLEADIRYQHLNIEILGGKYKGKKMTVRHTIERIMPGNYIFKNGDKILLRITEDNNQIGTVKIEEKVRDTQVYLIIILFIALVLIFGRISGLKTIVSLIFTLAMIFAFYIPMILKGFNPILSSILISIISIIATLFLISGKNKKTMVAVIGTAIGVILSGVLAIIFGKFASLTGLANDNAISLAYIPHFRDLNYQGILFGTILIGAIGAIMDVAMSISSALWELKEVNPKISKREMISSGLNIGRDILGSMSNTLILAYIGTTLHLIILFIVYRIYFIEIINLDSIATEIIRAMAGSIGLIITIPITVIVGAEYYLNSNDK